MNLPNYFLADLPAEATLSAGIITEACRTLKRNREQFLANRSTEGVINALCALGALWLEEDYSFRKMALEQGPGATGFSAEVIASGLDACFKQFAVENFRALIEQDLGHVKRLDEILATEPEQRARRRSIATAPGLQAHIAAGNLPIPAFTSMTLGLLTRSAQFVKCASGASFLPRLFAHSLYELDSKLGSCLEVAEWKRTETQRIGASEASTPFGVTHARFQWLPVPGENRSKPNGVASGNLLAEQLSEALFAEADLVTATGDDQTLAAIRELVPAGVRFIGYGHRLSFAFVSNTAWAGASARLLAEQFSHDITAWDQSGCLSPHLIYIEAGGSVMPLQFAEALAHALARKEKSHPRGQLPASDAAGISSRRSFYEIRAANSDETKLWCSKDSTSWTVVYEADPQFQTSCLNRFVYVKSVPNLTEALHAADQARGKVSTVGVASSAPALNTIAMELARWGATRVCPIGRMQSPPLTWRHDGRPSLGELILWTDIESE
jgi:hypothetical protein